MLSLCPTPPVGKDILGDNIPFGVSADSVTCPGHTAAASGLGLDRHLASKAHDYSIRARHPRNLQGPVWETLSYYFLFPTVALKEVGLLGFRRRP